MFVGRFVFPIKCDLSTESFQLLINLITVTDLTDTTTCLPFPFDVIYGNYLPIKKDICMVKLMYYTSELSNTYTATWKIIPDWKKQSRSPSWENIKVEL